MSLAMIAHYVRPLGNGATPMKSHNLLRRFSYLPEVRFGRGLLSAHV